VSRKCVANWEFLADVVRFKQEKENAKPIVLMISWFYGQKSQINKYSKLYTDQGMDVLVGRISLVQFLFNIKSVEVSREENLEVLCNFCHASIFPAIRPGHRRCSPEQRGSLQGDFHPHFLGWRRNVGHFTAHDDEGETARRAPA
jgi:hypothetical protein